MADLRTDDFEFAVTPVIITDQGAEMKRRICVAVSVLNPDTGGNVTFSTDFDDALVRIQREMFGGELDTAFWKADVHSDGEPSLVWSANFDRDRLGVHPDLERAVCEMPGGDPETLFYRFEGDSLRNVTDETELAEAPAAGSA